MRETVRAENAKPLKPLKPAFTVRLYLMIFSLVFFATVLFFHELGAMIRPASGRLLQEQAELCAAALVPGAGGDLSESVQQLKRRFVRLLAVGTLDAYGQLQTVYPAQSFYRRMASASLQSPGEALSMVDPESERPVGVVGSVVSLNGDPSQSARRVVVLLNTASPGRFREHSLLWFAGLFTAAALLAGALMNLWFDRNVTRPLKSMARGMDGHGRQGEASNTLRTGVWREIAVIAQHFCKLTELLKQSEQRIHHIQRQTAEQIERKQHGFDQQLRRAKDLASTDPLTRLRNRAFLEERLEPLFQHHVALHEDLSIVMLDLDNFKAYNDTHGHQVGDALLRFVGSMLLGGIRPTDHAVRYGGDEFLLILPGASAEQSREVAQRLIKLFHQYATRLDTKDRLSLSAGVASLRSGMPASGHALVAHADAALYAAKRDGKNSVADVHAA